MARVDVKIILAAALLTVFLFMGIYTLNVFLGHKREQVVERKMNEIIEDFEEIETAAYLMEFIIDYNQIEGCNAVNTINLNINDTSTLNDTCTANNRNTCNILRSELEYLETKLWKLDMRIRGYGEITRDFTNDEFYLREKRKLNRREIIHLSMLTRLRKMCGYEQTIILYFYGECKKNKKCDEQGFVLTYINQLIDPEIAIFSFDSDLNISSVDTLTKLYNITEYPCVIIEGNTHCGLHNKHEMIELLCKYNGNLSIC